MLCPIIVWSGLMTVLSALNSSDESWIAENLANVTTHILAKREAKSGYSEEEKKLMLDEHNNARAQEGAEDMTTLVWDNALEMNAQKHVDKCEMSHSSRSERTDIGSFKYVGENLFFHSATPDPKEVTKQWYDEKMFYTYYTMACTAGQDCGHYTQVVWAKTAAIGCGVKYCNAVGGIPGGQAPAGYLVNCQYGPGGNMVGSKPYKKAPPGSSSVMFRSEFTFVSFVILSVFYYFYF
ncbi:Peptidase inhibitor 16 [Bulinus truncatus]|nr:Peptidase inhibitor 16 [Bulinus truncatus]